MTKALTNTKTNSLTYGDGRKMTLKQRKWLGVYLKTGNATEAARQAYDVTTDDSAFRIGSENLSKLKIPINELMDRMGLSDGKLLKKLDEGLDAKRTVSARIIIQGGKDAGATTQTDDFIDVEDFATRHKYLETALKLKKHLGNDPTGNTVNIGQLNVMWQEGEAL